MKWTPRNSVNIALGGLASLVLAVLAISPLGLDVEERTAAQGLALGLLVGLVTPGSPVGLILDRLLGVRVVTPPPIPAGRLRPPPIPTKDRS